MSGKGKEDPGYTIKAEIKPQFFHKRGALCAARTNNPQKASSGSQFYIVHDELVFDVYKEELEIVKPIISSRMKNAIPLQIPVEVEMNTGANWLEAH